MKHTILFILFTFFGMQAAFCQMPVVVWQKSLGSFEGDYAHIIRTTSDGGFIVIGSADAAGGDVVGYHGNTVTGDFWVVKLSGTGAIQWQKCLNGPYFDEGSDVRQTPDGGYIIIGTAASQGCYIPEQHGGADYLVVKLTPTGEITWQKSYGGSKNEYAYSIDLTGDGGYVVGGFTESIDGDVTVNHGIRDYWIIKIDGAGNLKWQKSLGGSGDDAAFGIRATPDGGCIAVGYTESTDGDVTGNHGQRDFWTVKLDNTGNIQWQKAMGGTESDEGEAIQLTGDGGYILAGSTSSNNGDVSGNHQALSDFTDFWVVKLNSAGAIQWQNCYGGTYNEFAYYVQQCADGGYVVTGLSESADGDATCNAGYEDMWVIKVSATGALQWQKSMGGSGSEWGSCIQPLNDGSFIVAGLLTSREIVGYHPPSGSTEGDYWIVKLSQPVTVSPSPVVSISPASGRVCAGSATTFTASSLNAGTAPVYQWFKNGAAVGANSPLYTGTGFSDNDQLVCKVSNGRVCDLTPLNVSGTITIHVSNATIQPQVTISASNTIICNCDPIAFNASVLNGGTGSLYSWKINGEVVENNGNKFIGNLLVPGDIVSCVYRDSSACVINDSAISNEIKMLSGMGQPPTITILASTVSVCQGSLVSFVSVSGNAGTSPSYQWKVNGINAGTNSDAFSSGTFANGDVITCTLTPDASTNCIVSENANSNPVTITVNAKTPATINISASSQTICTGETVTFTATAVNAGTSPSYQWKVNGVNAGTSSNSFTTSALANGDAVTCTVAPDPLAYCVNSTTVTSAAVVIMVKSQVIPSIIISASPNEICVGDQINFIANAQNAGITPQYQWTINNVAAGSNSPSFTSTTLNAGDAILCTVTSTGGGCQALPVSSNTITPVVNQAPVISITPRDTTVLPGTVVKLNALVTGNVSSFAWSPPNLLADAATLNPVTLPLNSATTFTLMVLTDKGCKTSATVTVKTGRDLAMPNAFTPNGDGVNDVFRIPAGMIVSLREFAVFDRFGNRVFYTADPAMGWDGNYRGKPVAVGVYVYIIRGLGYNGAVAAKGSVTLLQ